MKRSLIKEKGVTVEVKVSSKPSGIQKFKKRRLKMVKDNKKKTPVKTSTASASATPPKKPKKKSQKTKKNGGKEKFYAIALNFWRKIWGWVMAIIALILFTILLVFIVPTIFYSPLLLVILLSAALGTVLMKLAHAQPIRGALVTTIFVVFVALIFLIGKQLATPLPTKVAATTPPAPSPTRSVVKVVTVTPKVVVNISTTTTEYSPRHATASKSIVKVPTPPALHHPPRQLSRDKLAPASLPINPATGQPAAYEQILWPAGEVFSVIIPPIVQKNYTLHLKFFSICNCPVAYRLDNERWKKTWTGESFSTPAPSTIQFSSPSSETRVYYWFTHR